MPSIEDASKYSINNRESLSKSKTAGCYYCLKIFKPSDVTEYWTTEFEDTGVCPHCGIDSVIGDDPGFDITDDLLKKLKKYWFY